MEQPIEKMTSKDLLDIWNAELEALRDTPGSNPHWDWKPIQTHLEQLHALAHEIRNKLALHQAKWQP